MDGERHRSIGEVLALLQDDFPDVTISKIRFLETQGLITPERTSSGYRKFYEADLIRLRWILTQQKDNFLPLKVIKGRLDSGDHDLVEAPSRKVEPALVLPGFEPSGPTGSLASSVSSVDPAAPHNDSGAAHGSQWIEPSTQDDPAVIDISDNADTAGLVEGFTNNGTDAFVAVVEMPGPGHEGHVDSSQQVGSAPPPVKAAGGDPQRFLSQGSALSMTPEELAAAAGLSVDQVTDLDRFGLISARALGGDRIYDEEALLVARLAAAFGEHGIEARHLRMYKVAAEREAGVFEQMLMPIARNQAAGRPVAAKKLAELASLGDGMREAMLRHSLSQHLI